ncbi:uncharacterized protein LOC113774066 [Coffea eugenioides]|uniref:uncharacterized protein LOC113774066 n=1 Tax=Coffea eugenioides TaxID=49369 RepID=UPI000F615A38|nr:uncharacterized protein LOC113774066 [Coffea eugenioides]
MHVKSKLQDWSRQSFGDIFQAVKDTEENLRQRQEEFDAARDDLSRMKLEEARAKYAHALGVECDYCKQKSAIKWIQERDVNTKFFHSFVKRRRSVNFILRIKDDAGHWLEDEEEVKASVEQFFAKLFMAEREGRAAPCFDFSLPSLTNEDNMKLQQLPSLQELKEVVFSMSKDSSPGPDCFGAGLVPGRSITDNILVAQELAMDIDRKLQCPNLMLKLDMEKVYDRVE